MTKPEFCKAFEIANSDIELNETNASIVPFDGFGLTSFEPVWVTLKQVARLIRWQCWMWDGGVDHEALNEIGKYGRKRFLIVGE